MKKRMIWNVGLLGILLAGASIACGEASPEPQNLLQNQGFEAGNTGFTSSYRYTSSPYSPGSYTIGPNPFPDNSLWPSMKPHNGREMMIVNGREGLPSVVWSERALPVKPHESYYFTGYVASLFSVAPPALMISINGKQAGPILAMGPTTAQWTRFSIPWDSGASRVAEISIFDLNTQAYGNDFALDDLAFSTTAKPLPPQPVQSWQPPGRIAEQARPPERPVFGGGQMWNRPPVIGSTYPQGAGYGYLGAGFMALGIGLGILGLSLVVLGFIFLRVVIIQRRG